MYVVQFINGELVSSPTQFSPLDAFNDYCTMVEVAHKRKFNETDRDAALLVWLGEMIKHHEIHLSYNVDENHTRQLSQYLVTTDGRS